MQAGAALLAQHVGGKAGLPVATRMNDVRFKRMVRPGETIEIDVELGPSLQHLYVFYNVRSREDLLALFDEALPSADAFCPADVLDASA